MVTRLFIGNIARNITDFDLVTALRTIGIEAQRARIATEKESGTPRGFGFIEIETDVEAALKAINGFVVGNRPLRAERAARQPDEDRDRQRGPRPPARDFGPGDGGGSGGRDSGAWREEMRGKRGRGRSNARW